MTSHLFDKELQMTTTPSPAPFGSYALQLKQLRLVQRDAHQVIDGIAAQLKASVDEFFDDSTNYVPAIKEAADSSDPYSVIFHAMTDSLNSRGEGDLADELERNLI
jgi:hypothetical protein